MSNSTTVVQTGLNVVAPRSERLIGLFRDHLKDHIRERRVGQEINSPRFYDCAESEGLMAVDSAGDHSGCTFNRPVGAGKGPTDLGSKKPAGVSSGQAAPVDADLGATAAGHPASHETHAQANRRPLKSQKLDRTLAELENAFAAWDSINEEGGTSASPADQKASALTPPDVVGTAAPVENDFRNKTRKLLTQLRKQIADLSKE